MPEHDGAYEWTGISMLPQLLQKIMMEMHFHPSLSIRSSFYPNKLFTPVVLIPFASGVDALKKKLFTTEGTEEHGPPDQI